MTAARTPAGAPGRFRLSVAGVPLLFAAVVLLAVAAGLWSISSGSERGPAPGVLAGHELDSVMVGAEALADINQLHGKEIEDILYAWVGHYHGGATVWLASAAREDVASQMLEDMVEGIKKGGSPFTGLAAGEHEGRQFYSVTDGRQMHFFYRSGFNVIWVAAPKGSEDEFLVATFNQVGPAGGLTDEQ